MLHFRDEPSAFNLRLSLCAFEAVALQLSFSCGRISKTQHGGSYPAIFIYGYVNAVLGVWQSTDNCVSWQKIGDAQFGGKTFDNPNCMAGDMNTPGVVYVGFLGSGYLQYS